MTSNYSNLNVWKDNEQTYFIIANIKIFCTEYMIECIFKISRCEHICVILFVSPQHCMYKKPKPPRHHVAVMHGTAVVSVLTACPVLNLKKCVVQTRVSRGIFLFDSAFEFFLALFLADFNTQLSSLENLWHKSELICVTHSLR